MVVVSLRIGIRLCSLALCVSGVLGVLGLVVLRVRLVEAASAMGWMMEQIVVLRPLRAAAPSAEVARRGTGAPRLKASTRSATTLTTSWARSTRPAMRSTGVCAPHGQRAHAPRENTTFTWPVSSSSSRTPRRGRSRGAGGASPPPPPAPRGRARRHSAADESTRAGRGRAGQLHGGPVRGETERPEVVAHRLEGARLGRSGASAPTTIPAAGRRCSGLRPRPPRALGGGRWHLSARGRRGRRRRRGPRAVPRHLGAAHQVSASAQGARRRSARGPSPSRGPRPARGGWPAVPLPAGPSRWAVTRLWDTCGRRTATPCACASAIRLCGDQSHRLGVEEPGEEGGRVVMLEPARAVDEVGEGRRVGLGNPKLAKAARAW